jgi:MerR family transcriptional regulator, redox-sensitive transcriptional activator SoxR
MLSIGEVAERAGLRPSALRYYEEAGLLPCPDRVSGRRRYQASVLGRLRVISCAQSAGFTIAEIRELIRGEDGAQGAWRELAERKLLEVNALIEKAQATRRLLEDSLHCACQSLEDCSTAMPRTPVKKP